MTDITFMTHKQFQQKYPTSASILHYNSMQTKFGLVLYVMIDESICALGFGFDRAGNALDEDSLLQKMRDDYWLLQESTGYQIQKNTQLRDIKADIENYLSSKGNVTPPILAVGSPFQSNGWQALCKVAYGDKTTYGGLAEKMGSHARAVATNIVAKNPIALFLPCHRIIHSDGGQKYAYGAGCKEALQRAEG